MPKEHFFFSQEPVNDTISLEGKEYHHLLNVMRKKVQQTIHLINGKGELYQGVIQTLNKKKGDIKLKLIEKLKRPTTTLVLAQGIPRLNKLDLIIEKGTELGISKFLLFPSERSEKKPLSCTLLKRLEAISISAIKQCGRLWLPDIEIAPPIKAWEKPIGHLFFGSLDVRAPSLLNCVKKNIKEILIVIGPESGLSEYEIECLEKLKFQGVKINSHVLRTETCAIAASAVLGGVIL